MDTVTASELGHAKWRVHFLQRVLHVHRTAGHCHTETWTIEEEHFLQQIASAEDRLHALEIAFGEKAESPGEAPQPSRSESTTGAIPSSGQGLPSRGMHARYSPPFRGAHVFSSGSLSE